MFKNLFNPKPLQHLSPYRPTSPFRPNRTPVKIQRQSHQRSPIRNRPSDIKNLKTFLNTIVPKNNTSPIRMRSPIKIQNVYEVGIGRDVSPRRATLRQETRYVSPSRITSKSKYQLYDTRKGAETWRVPSQVIGNPPSHICKQNSKLFTNLIKNIKSQGDDTQHTDQYNRRRIQVQTANAAIKRQTSLFQQFNRVQSQIHFQTETKIKQTETYIQIEQKSVVEFKDSKDVHHSFGVPFIESITPSKHRGTGEQMEMTLRPGVVQSFGNRIMLERDQSREMRESLSDNDRVIESSVSEEFQLNMSLTK